MIGHNQSIYKLSIIKLIQSPFFTNVENLYLNKLYFHKNFFN